MTYKPWVPPAGPVSGQEQVRGLHQVHGSGRRPSAPQASEDRSLRLGSGQKTRTLVREEVARDLDEVQVPQPVLGPGEVPVHCLVQIVKEGKVRGTHRGSGSDLDPMDLTQTPPCLDRAVV